MSKFINFQSVKVLTGKYAGMAGSVVECHDTHGRVKLEIQGVQDDVAVNKMVWFKFEQVEIL